MASVAEAESWNTLPDVENIPISGISWLTTDVPRSWTFGDINWSRPIELCKPGKAEKQIDIPVDHFENVTCPFPMIEFPTWEVGLKIAFYAVAIFLAVVGNLCVLFTVIFNKRMHTRTYFYIANMAIFDLIIGVFNMWVHLGINITNDWPFSALLCKLYSFFQIIALTGSTGCMTVIAGERFFATMYPMKAKFSRAYKHVIIVVVVWVIAVAVAVPMLLVRDMSMLIWADREQKWCDEVWPRYITGDDPDPEFFCTYKYPERQAYYAIQVVVMYMLPVVVTSVTYTFICFTLRKRMTLGHPNDRLLEIQQQTKRKVMRMLIIVFAVFVVCWTPQEIIVLLDVHQPEESNQNIPEWLRYMAIYIAFFNSSLNPILYAGLNRNCRKAFWELIKSVACRSQKVAPGQTGTVRKPRSSGAAGNPDPTAQAHKKSLTLRQQGQPRLPPIQEDQSETWSNLRYAGDCDKATDTREDADDSRDPAGPDLERRNSSGSSASNVTSDGTVVTVLTSATSGPRE